MPSTVSTVSLNNGALMPLVGLGTYLSKEGECEQAVRYAIDAGYRHIDTAFLYGNEVEVGRAVRAKIAEGIVKREDMFIVTKLGNFHHHPDQVRCAAQKSLDDLDLGPTIDLYLMHTPMGFEPDDTDYIDTWRAMEQLVQDGLVRSLGVSNFNREQLARLLQAATIKPVTNQVECSPNLAQPKMREFCAKHNIVLTAYGPLTRPHRTAEGQLTALNDPLVKRLGDRYSKTPAQICVRYMIQLNTVPIPKSVNEQRIRENFDVFDFELLPIEIEELQKLDGNQRMCLFGKEEGHKYYPFGNAEL